MKYSVGDMIAVTGHNRKILGHWIIVETPIHLGQEMYKIYSLQNNNFDRFFAESIDQSPLYYVRVQE